MAFLNSNWPECPESVALALMEKILEREDQTTRRNEPAAARILALYAECLAVAQGRDEMLRGFLQ